MKKKILIVEDEDILREINKDYFLDAGYEVLEAKNGVEALILFKSISHLDLIILDIMMPELDGWAVCKKIRETSVIPIIIVTARADENDTLMGFELGADDYVTKPFSPKVLLARAKRLLHSQHSSKVTEQNDKLISKNLVLDLRSHSLNIDGQAIELTHTEFEILSYLMKNKNIVISREQLIVKIWGYDYAGDDRTINTHILNLRNKLGERANLIKTIVRAGYKFEDES